MHLARWYLSACVKHGVGRHAGGRADRPTRLRQWAGLCAAHPFVALALVLLPLFGGALLLDGSALAFFLLVWLDQPVVPGGRPHGSEARAGTAGSRTTNRAPRPGPALSAHTLPP